MQHHATVIGAGLAGCEAAWQLAHAGIRVRLVEMKPHKRTPAQVSDFFAELVCSNSLRSNNPMNAIGLIKEEMLAAGSLIIQQALTHKVPAGDALAVNREHFGQAITQALKQHPLITCETRAVETLPQADEGPCIIATGPLTDAPLAQALHAVTGKTQLYFYDAIAPIVETESLDKNCIFEASRYDKGDSADYLNCPLSKEEYTAFIQALRTAQYMPLHAFEDERYFQGCLPIEVMAARGDDALRFGPMKPVGLTDPRTGKRPYAVVQLRKEDVHGQAYNLVGFQTKLTYPEQKRIFSMIPGLQQAVFLRLGAIHRNTYIDSPSLLDSSLRLKTHPHIRMAGQITGVEGYVESAACGLLAGLFLAAECHQTALAVPPPTSALGALYSHVLGLHSQHKKHEPQNVNWSMFPPLEGHVAKSDQKTARVERARRHSQQWVSALSSIRSAWIPQGD